MADARSIVAKASARSREHLIALDGCLAAVLVLGSAIAVSRLHFSGPMPVAVCLALLCTSSVGYRRLAPEAALVVATSVTPVYQALTRDPSGAFVVAAVVVNAYLLGRVVQLAFRRGQLLALGYAFALTVVTARVSGAPLLGAVVTAVVLVIAPAALGSLAGRRHSMMVRLAATTDRLADQRSGSASRAATAERNRIARELHDVVAHNVSVMVIQAGAARVIAAVNPDAARDALRIVLVAGGDALRDLRRIMGVLHGEDAGSPDPGGMGVLRRLVEGAADAGVSAELQVMGDGPPLGEALELVVYRVVQESLTNVAKHAGPTRARVDVNLGADTIEVRVSNDRGTAPPPGSTLPGGGHGLLGMRERVTACGGQLRTSRRADGGFEVSARIPLAATGDARRVVPPYLSSRRRLASVRSIRWWGWPAALAWLVALELSVAATVRPSQRPLAAALVAAVALMVGVRRRAPLLFLLTVGCLAVTYAFVVHPLATQSLVGDFMVTVVPYTVARHEDRLRALIGQGVWCAGAATFAFASHQGPGTAAGAIVMGTLVWTVGRVWRDYAQLRGTLEERRSLLEEELDGRATLAIAGERSRIARELHYTVAQEVVAMVVQARAAQDPTATTAASHTPLAQTAEALEVTGRNALLRMREILGVLRAPGDLIACGPAPGVEQLPDLVHAMREAGRQVSLTVEGEPIPLAAGIGTAVYRIVEESLSAADHELPMRILLRFTSEHLALTFTGGPSESPEAVRRWVEMFDGIIEPESGQKPSITVRLPLVVDRAVLV